MLNFAEMKRILLNLLITIALLVTTTSCERYIAPDITVRRTVLIYMEARNTLSGTSHVDISEMKLASIPSDCRVLVYHSANGTAPQLFEIINGREVVRKLYPDDTAATNPEQLRSVITTVQSIAPAKEYGLVLWSHSSGWQQSMNKVRGFGYENSREQISVSDLADAIEGLNLDFLVFDTCYMGCVEVAYELRNAAHYMVSSVCEVPGDGMPYDQTLSELLREDMVQGLKNAIDITVTSYLGTNGCPSTLSLIDLTQLDALALAVKNATGTLPEDYTPQVFSISSPYRYLFYDFGQYFDAIGGDESAKNNAILHERHTAYVWGQIPLTHCSGLSVYLPQFSPGYNYESYGYSSLEWPQFLNLTD